MGGGVGGGERGGEGEVGVGGISFTVFLGVEGGGGGLMGDATC